MTTRASMPMMSSGPAGRNSAAVSHRPTMLRPLLRSLAAGGGGCNRQASCPGDWHHRVCLLFGSQHENTEGGAATIRRRRHNRIVPLPEFQLLIGRSPLVRAQGRAWNLLDLLRERVALPKERLLVQDGLGVLVLRTAQGRVGGLKETSVASCKSNALSPRAPCMRGNSDQRPRRCDVARTNPTMMRSTKLTIESMTNPAAAAFIASVWKTRGKKGGDARAVRTRRGR